MFFFLLKNFTNFDRLDIKINLVPSVFLLSTCQIALIKRNFKRRKLKKVKKLKKKKDAWQCFQSGMRYIPLPISWTTVP